MRCTFMRANSRFQRSSGFDPIELVGMADLSERLVDRIREASALGTPLRITGGDTKHFLGREPRGERVDVSGHTGVLSYEPTELVLTVRSGTSIAETQAVLNESGQCLEMPAESLDSTFRDRVKVKAYPVEELGGLIWAYLGPAPAPLLPRWDLLVEDNVLRDIGVTVLPCNWMQCMENSVDPTHAEWLHSYLSTYVLEREGATDAWIRPMARHYKIGFDVFEHGIIKRRVLEGGTEEDPAWRVGHPIIFPNYLRVGTGFQMRMPIDDTHTLHMVYSVYQMPPGVEAPAQESVPLFEIPLEESPGRFVVDYTLGQDMMAWATQGPVARRDLEKLGESDVGIILFRKLLGEQMELAAQGGDPINTFRDPVANESLELFQEYRGGSQVSRANLWIRQGSKFSPVVPIADELYAAVE